MEHYARRRNLLHLSGITLSDYVPVEDLFDEKVLEGAAREEFPLDPLPYDKIPAVFSGLDDWPAGTNLLCWACPFSFDGPPRFAPTYIRQGERGRLEVGVEGNFCTFNCAARYIDSAYPQKHWRMRDNLCTVYQMFTGRRVPHIPAAPSKTELRMFGGTLSEDQFWGAMRRLDLDHGLRDHRLGSVAPERTRPRAAAPGPRGPTMWEVGRAPPPSPLLDDLQVFPDLAAAPAAAEAPAPAPAPSAKNGAARAGNMEEYLAALGIPPEDGPAGP